MPGKQREEGFPGTALSRSTLTREFTEEVSMIKKTLITLATVGVVGAAAVAAPAPAEARGIGPGLGFGLAAGALIAGAAAASAAPYYGPYGYYDYGPRYYAPGYAYYGGPAYYPRRHYYRHYRHW
jgi:hypothetical protein